MLSNCRHPLYLLIGTPNGVARGVQYDSASRLVREERGERREAEGSRKESERRVQQNDSTTALATTNRRPQSIISALYGYRGASATVKPLKAAGAPLLL